MKRKPSIQKIRLERHRGQITTGFVSNSKEFEFEFYANYYEKLLESLMQHKN